MPENTKHNNPSGEDDMFVSLLAAGFVIAAAYGVHKFLTRGAERRTLEQRHLFDLEREVGRIYAEEADI